MKSKWHIPLWVGWALAFGLSLACFVALLAGIARDARWGEPTIPLDFSEVSGWQSESFRVWGEETYNLRLSSVNHDPEYAGRFLAADFRIRILGADDQSVLDRLYRGETLDHSVPQGYSDLLLARLDVRGKPWRPGKIQVRVSEPDPAFKTTRSELKLWKERPNVGMGGLINYALMVPGGVLWVVSLVLAALLAGRHSRWPLLLTALSGAVGLAGLSLG